MEDSNLFDKVVEMGMGMAMVSQIPSLLNSVLPSGQSAEPTPPPLDNDGLKLYAHINGVQSGPLTEQEVITLIQRRLIVNQTLVWKSKMTTWLPAQQVPEVGRLLMLYSNNVDVKAYEN